MKNYKVGDTIYVKGTIVDSDCAQQYLIKSGDHTYGFWFKRDAIADLPEPVKPVLPKNVADEIQQAKDMRLNFYMYIIKFSNDSATCDFAFHNCLADVSDEQFKILSDAWYNGYTVKQAPRYKVYAPGTNKQFMYVKRGSWAKVDNKKATPITPQSINNYLTAGGNRDLYWFTDEEITKFDLQNCEKELVADD